MTEKILAAPELMVTIPLCHATRTKPQDTYGPRLLLPTIYPSTVKRYKTGQSSLSF